MKVVPMEVTLLDHMGSDLSVVNAARVSFHKESTEFVEQDERLINYLAKHKHHSPFNHTFITVRVKAPIFVARQLVKHKFMPWNEVSRRYVDDEPEFYFPEVWRGRPVNVKQGSNDVKVKLKPLSEGHEDLWGDVDNDFEIPLHAELLVDNNLGLYKWMIDSGVAPEQARMVLPQNTMTEWYWSGTLGAFADMLVLRLDPHAQQESREVAEKIRDAILPLFPVSLKALLEN